MLVGALYGAAYYVAINSLALPMYFNDPLPWQLGASTVLPRLVGHVIFDASDKMKSGLLQPSDGQRTHFLGNFGH